MISKIAALFLSLSFSIAAVRADEACSSRFEAQRPVSLPSPEVGAQDSPALTPVTGGLVAAWRESGQYVDRIRLSKLDSLGHIVSSAGTATTTTTSNKRSIVPRLAAADDVLLLTWMDVAVDQVNLYGEVFTFDLGQIGLPVLLVTYSTSQADKPVLAPFPIWNGREFEVLAPSGAGSSTLLRWGITKKGIVSSQAQLVTGSTPITRVAAAVSNAESLVTYEARDAVQADIRGLILRSDDNSIVRSVILSSQHVCQYFCPLPSNGSVTWNGLEFLAVWSEYQSDVGDRGHAARLARDGTTKASFLLPLPRPYFSEPIILSGGSEYVLISHYLPSSPVVTDNSVHTDCFAFDGQPLGHDFAVASPITVIRAATGNIAATLLDGGKVAVAYLVSTPDGTRVVFRVQETSSRSRGARR